MLKFMIEMMERGFLPDWLIRAGIRNFCRERLASLEQNFKSVDVYARSLKAGPLAYATKEANEQHYEVPTAFFLSVLGRHRKYSCAYFEPSVSSLDEAESKALAVTVERAQLADGMKILELGCGWGSLSLYMAERFPNSTILAVSNSQTQRLFIEKEAFDKGLKNLTVITQDLSADAGQMPIRAAAYDRVVSVEMFEHFHNYELLLDRVAGWLKPGGKLFVHIFSHRRFAYPFESEGESNWMGKYFFTGGQMPAHQLFAAFQARLQIEEQWQWAGSHYKKTAEAWLKNLDTHRAEILHAFQDTYGSEAKRWLNRWRVFFISCAELFGYADGQEWGVSHYLFQRK